MGVVVPLLAQDAAPAAPDEGDKVPKVRVSLLAIGDLPPILYKATAKGPVWIEPPKADFPPPLLYVGNKDKEGGFDKLNVGLNTPMAAIEHPGGKVLKIFEDKADALAKEAETAAKAGYLTVPLPAEKVDLTVFLLRNPGSKSWRTTPKSFAFKNDPVSFPPDSVRVVNFSSHPVRASIAGEVVDLSPLGRPTSMKILGVANAQRVLKYQLGAILDGKPLVLADTATSFYPGTRLNMIIYDGDSKESGGAIKFCSFSEMPIVKEPAPKVAPVAGAVP